jgi:hypothetical protein
MPSTPTHRFEGKTVLGVIDSPILSERIVVDKRTSELNGRPVRATDISSWRPNVRTSWPIRS